MGEYLDDEEDEQPTLAQERVGCICAKACAFDSNVIVQINQECPLHGSGMDW